MPILRTCAPSWPSTRRTTTRPDRTKAIGQRVPDAEHDPARIPAGDFQARQIRRKPVPNGLINEYVRAA
jgi:hypothetical protein